MLAAVFMVAFAAPTTTAWADEDLNNPADTDFVNDEMCIYGAGGSGGGSPKLGSRASNPVTVNYNGASSYVYRGGSSFTVTSKDIRINSATGNVKTTHGVSLNVNPSSLTGLGGAYRIESIPVGVNIIQRGKPEHYEIVPAYEMPLNTYQGLLNRVRVTGPY